MSKFPAGSKVIITGANTTEPYKNGDIFTVKGSSNGIGVEVDHNGEERYLASYEFEAYGPEFKVGDSVVTTAGNEEWGYSLGDTGTVDEVDTYEPRIRLKGAGYIYSHDLKLVEPFKVGDTVRLKDGSGAWAGVEGTVLNIHPGLVNIEATTPNWRADSFRTGDKLSFSMERLQKVEPLAEWEKELLEGALPRPISFADIKKGDKTQAEFTLNGVKRTHEGVADSFIYGDWFSAGGDFVANEGWDATYTLLERPDPEPVNPFAEAKVGSLALATQDKYTRYKVADNTWKFIYKEESRLSLSSNTDEEMARGGFELFHIVK